MLYNINQSIHLNSPADGRDGPVLSLHLGLQLLLHVQQGGALRCIYVYMSVYGERREWHGKDVVSVIDRGCGAEKVLDDRARPAMALQ